MSGWQKVNSSSSSTSSKTRLSGRSRSGISSDDRPSYSRTVRLGRVEPQAPTDRTIYCNDRDSNLSFGFMEVFLGGLFFIFIYSLIRENLSYVIYVIMSTFYFYLNLLLVPVAALLGDVIYQGIQRWFLPYNYQIVQEIHRHEPDEFTREGALHASQSLNLLARLRNIQGLRSTHLGTNPFMLRSKASSFHISRGTSSDEPA